jgi:formiminotetrahydrofolate cyclodeaminase
MPVYREAAIATYLEDAASKKPAPGGGSVSALTGALAAAMAEMAANFTAGREKYAAVEEQVRATLAELAQCRAELLELMDADVAAYTAVSAAYSMPADSDEQKQARRGAVDRALRGAMQVPLRIMRLCAQVSAAADLIARIGNPNLITDAGVSAILAEAACAAARLNVEVNLKFLEDDSLSRETNAEMDGLTAQTQAARQSVARAVAGHLRGKA